uniref:BAAT/Acyl-CoA thioester hydrolase C-terminal domain-containing protein n=1 Tax=Junco hyemalis TaxID=40217 RepID=A0A8C5IE52_JUNHY
LALAYYQFEDLPQEPKELHLEYFEEAVNYMLQHPQVKGPGVGLLGFSKGAEVSLAMAAFLKNILAVASLNAPVAVTAIPLSYKDKIIPTLTLHEYKAKATNSTFFDYSYGMDDPFQAPGDQSRIPLEKGEAQLLFMLNQLFWVFHFAGVLQASLIHWGKPQSQQLPLSPVMFSAPGHPHCSPSLPSMFHNRCYQQHCLIRLGLP